LKDIDEMRTDHSGQLAGSVQGHTDRRSSDTSTPRQDRRHPTHTEHLAATWTLHTSQSHRSLSVCVPVKLQERHSVRRMAATPYTLRMVPAHYSKRPLCHHGGGAWTNGGGAWTSNKLGKVPRFPL